MLRPVRASIALPVVVGIVAFGVRLISLVQASGLHGLLGYDEGVYMGAATALVHGLVPYRDFVLVHPPGSTLLLTPFALIGKSTSESTAWAAARLFVVMVGAVNAALVTVVARRVSTLAAVVGGLLYALWGPSIHVERTTMLEAFVLLALLAALVTLRRPDDSMVRVASAGVLLGLGTSVKLWGGIALVVFAVWLLMGRAWRSSVVLLASGVIAFSVIVLPFVVLAKGRVFDLIVLAQLDRGRGGTDVVDRPARMLALGSPPGLPARTGLVVVLSIAVVVLAVLAAARRPASRLWVALLVAQTTVLLVVPVYFAGYSSFIGPALALTVGAGIDVAARDVPVRTLRPLAWVAAGATVTVLALGGAVSGLRDPGLVPGPDPRVDAAAEPAQCVGSDSAGVLLMYDLLGRSIDRGCPTLIDVDGTLYGVDPSNPSHSSATRRREDSISYQRVLRDYLQGNDVVLIHRAAADAMSPETRRLLESKQIAVRTPGVTVYADSAHPALADSTTTVTAQ